jgi:hypothetical protein
VWDRGGRGAGQWVLTHFSFRKAKWKFEKLNGHFSRIFTDLEWYFETLSVIRNFAFSTEVVLHHAFPPRLPPSLFERLR